MHLLRRLPQALGAPLVLAMALTGANSGQALADCVRLSPWPSFTQSAGSANRIIIGTVVWTPGGQVNSRFTLRVDEVLRGQAPAKVDFAAFRSGAPQPVCPEDSLLRVRRVGDRLAIAYGAHLSVFEQPITAVAFVAPSRPDRGLMPDMERLTVAQVRAIAALPPTDIAAKASASSPAVMLVGGGLGVLVALAFTLRRRSLRVSVRGKG